MPYIGPNFTPDSVFEPFVRITPGRVFVNSNVGCLSSCVYCYIFDYGFGGKPKIAPFSGKDLFTFLSKQPQFRQGREGTVLSFGCFSESLRPPFSAKTFEFIASVAKLGNPIQVATKWSITKHEASILASFCEYAGQIIVFFGATTFAYWRKVEPGTRSPWKRLEGIPKLQRLGIPCCIYIKPVLAGITDLELSTFVDAIHYFEPRFCVVGDLFVSPRIYEEITHIPGFRRSPFDAGGSRILPVPGEMLPQYPQYEAIDYLVREFRKLPNLRVFKSSLCATSTSIGVPPPQPIWDDDSSCVRGYECCIRQGVSAR